MELKTFIFCCFLQLAYLSSLYAQNLTGTVKEYADDGKTTPVAGAFLQWKKTAVGTVTDINGNFTLKRSTTDTLIVNYQTYKPDTIVVPKTQTQLDIILSSAHSLNAVTVSAADGAYISVKPIFTTVITTEGLRKAACCNLSESFDNTVAVDVEYSDAVSGAKQISMLGLAGIYSQILLENTPFVRLLSNQFGLGYVPGSWMESISISKGTSSVTNGYESITGQINVEYKKPETNKEKFFLNVYGSSMGKAELNMNTRFDVSKNVSTMFLLHTESQLAKVDMNKDSFLDLPLNYQVNFMNRWDFNKPGKYEGRTMISYLWEDRIGGQKNFKPKSDKLSDQIYGMGISTNKLNVITKNGFLLKGDDESIGTILSFTLHDNASYFGNRPYNAQQLSGYANVLYSNRFGKDHSHKLTAGASFQIDHLYEKLVDSVGKRDEVVPGLFAEYSYSIHEKLVLMGGFRADYNSLHGLFWTPRIHIKWQATPTTSLRLSAGKGYRVANVISENMSLLVSNRTFNFKEELDAEEAYNFGASLTQSFEMKGGTSTFSIDYYYTHFINQTIIDLDRSPHYVDIYNLKGKSYSSSIQAEFMLFPVKRFEIIIAYRFNDVRQTLDGKLQRKALVSPHKAVLNLNYSTKFDKWKFNATLQYNSSMRLPNTSENPAEYQVSANSPDYFTLNAQITRKYKGWEFYIGGENLTNYKQKNPVLSADNPFGEYFDASIIYAPITGIMGYIGFRWTLK